MHKIYVYGTLRPGKVSNVSKGRGFLFDLGSFPGVKLDPEGPEFTVESIEVDDKTLERLDRYEGYRASNPESSLYIRKPFLDGEIYEYNGVSSGANVESGDWLIHTGRNQGSASSLVPA